MSIVLAEEPARRAPARLVRPRVGGSDGGCGGNAGRGPEGRGSGPVRQWPLVPAVLVAVLLAALLTLLGMYTQIQANLAGTQLPGA